MNILKRILSVSLLVLLVAGVTGCGGSDEGEAQGDQLTGSVRVDGSSTVFPITEAVAEEFMGEHRDVRVNVGVSGTGGGFSRFLRKETDINDASRPIKATEIQQAQENDIEYIELPVAYDGIAVMVNPQNDWLECLTVDELEKIWAPGSDVTNWNQIRSSFPDRELHLYGPDTDSGTYDYFTEAIVGEEGASRSDYTASADDNVLVQGIAGDEGALGFFGLAYYEENQDKLKLIGVDDGDSGNGEGCVQPSTETVGNGTYQPLSRPVFIYVNAAQADDPAVQTFVEFYLDHAGELAQEVGYIALSSEAYDLAMQRFRNRVTGSVFESGGSQVGLRLEDLLQREEGGAGAADTTATAAPDTSAAS